MFAIEMLENLSTFSLILTFYPTESSDYTDKSLSAVAMVSHGAFMAYFLHIQLLICIVWTARQTNFFKLFIV